SSCAFFFFQAEDGIRDWSVTGVQTCALPISTLISHWLLECSTAPPPPQTKTRARTMQPARLPIHDMLQHAARSPREAFLRSTPRSEERRVGKEGRTRWLGSE